MTNRGKPMCDMKNKSFRRAAQEGALIRSDAAVTVPTRVWHATPVILSLFLSACVVGPDYQAPALNVPAVWKEAAKTNSVIEPSMVQPGAWWRQLGDPILDELIADASTGSLDVATARAKVREARGVARQAGAARYPALSGSAAFKRSGGGIGAAGSTDSAGLATSSLSSVNTPTSIYQAGFDASWELDLFGANRRAAEVARYGLDAAAWNLRAVQLSLIGEVATYYVTARGYQARLELARNTATSQQETARLTRIRLEAGAASALDAANAEGLAQTTLSAIPELETAYVQTVAALAVVSGKTPDALVGRMAERRPIPIPKLPIPAGVPADVLLARPDVRLAERQYAQYTARVGQAQAARYPSVSLTGSILTSGAQFGDLGSRSTIGWSIGPSLSIPLFNAGRLKAAVEIADAQREQYFIAYNASVLAALKDVENASVALSRETSRVKTLRASAAAYQQAAQLARTLYDAGSTGFLDTLTAERSLFSSQDALIQSQVLIANDYIALNKALGGGWDGVADLAAAAGAGRWSNNTQRSRRN
jgi:outer membrane protein, multidrug efflux system